MQYFFKYVLTYSLHLNSYLVTFFIKPFAGHNFLLLFIRFTISLNMLFNYHLLYFCTALSLIIMLSSHYYLHKSKTLSQLTQCPFTGTLLLFCIVFQIVILWVLVNIFSCFLGLKIFLWVLCIPNPMATLYLFPEFPT